MRGVDLVKLVVYTARRYEQEPAVAFAGGVATYRVLMGATAAAVQMIEAMRLQHGAVVLLDVRNPVYHIALIYALSLCGIRSASVATTHVVERAGPRPAMTLTDRDDLASTPQLHVRKVDPRWFAYDESRDIDYMALLRMPGFTDPDDVFRLIYSSGTTGRPKCVGLSNRVLDRRIANSELQSAQRNRSGATLNTMGFSTVLGTMMPFMNHLHGGLLCFATAPADVLQMIRVFGVSYFTGSVAQLYGIVQAMGGSAPPPSLKTIAAAGSRLPLAQLMDLRARLASHIMGGYGSTEMGRVSHAEGRDLERNEGAVGLCEPYVSIEITDDAGNPLPAGVEGVIRVKSDELAVYVDESGATSPVASDDGWFYPGDVGRIEPDGVLIITGRTSEIINRGGVVVAPEAIEDVLRLDGRFSDLAVVGVPNAMGIDEIWAAVVCAEAFDAAAVIAAAKVKLNERAPDRVIGVPAIPRNENGKVMRNGLRDELLALSRA